MNSNEINLDRNLKKFFKKHKVQNEAIKDYIRRTLMDGLPVPE